MKPVGDGAYRTLTENLYNILLKIVLVVLADAPNASIIIEYEYYN